MLMPFPLAKNKGERKVERVRRPATAANGEGKPDERVVYCGEFQNGSCTLQDNHGGKFFGQSVVFQHICATCWKELKTCVHHPASSTECPLSRTPDLRIFLAEKMRMGVFGQERGEISAFLYGKKCGGNADKMRMGVFRQERGEISAYFSAFLYGKKCGGNAEKMRMGVFGQEYGEISAFQP